MDLALDIIWYKNQVIKYQEIRWWFNCVECGILTANEVCYLVLLRRDVDQITSPMCNRCKNTLHHYTFRILRVVRHTEHRTILVVKL